MVGTESVAMVEECRQVGSVTDASVRGAIEYFAERVSHDLNNILTPLVAYPEILASQITDERGQKMVKAMQESVSQALAMMQRLATMAGIDAGPAGTLDLTAIAKASLEEIQRQLGEMDGLTLRLDLEGPCEVRFQREAFLHAWEALLENAIRVVASSGGGTVTVGGERVRTDCMAGAGGERIPQGEYQTIWIADSGPGMSTEEQQRMVEPFCTGEWRNPGCGSGLGLSVAYCCLKRGGAYLGVESQAKQGTKLTLYFPVQHTDAPATDVAAQPEQPRISCDQPSLAPLAAEPKPSAADRTNQTEAQPSESSVSEAGRRRVLVVDDERSIVNLFQMILENFIDGIQVDTAENGAEALESFKQVGHEVIVMDLHMPLLDGQAAFYEIQKYCKLQDVPMPSFVFCTGYAPRATLRQTIAEDQRHLLLNKPVQSEVLVDAVRKRLRVAQ